MEIQFLFLLGGHVAVVLVGLIILFTICYLLIPHPPKINLIGSHVVITGGSRGIGKAIAREVVLEGANVTLIARDAVKLAEARKELQALLAPSSTLRIEWFALDLTSCKQIEIDDAIAEAERRMSRPVDVLINNCGGAINTPFQDLSVSNFDAQMKLNFLSAVACTKAVLPSMQQNSKACRIVLVSSMAGQLGMFGYTAYSASKFALRGFAESLQMELRPHNIGLSLVFPPDTNTDGYAKEQLTIPPELAAISEEAGVWEPRTIAQHVTKQGVKQGNFFVSFGLEGWMLARITSGMAPVHSSLEAVEQVLCIGLLRFVGIFYGRKFSDIVARMHKKKQA